MLSGSMIPRAVKRIFDERSEPRELASGVAELEHRGCKHRVRLVNLSSAGAMVICDLLPHIGEPVSLQLGDRGPMLGQVCWVRDGKVGVNFAAANE